MKKIILFFSVVLLITFPLSGENKTALIIGNGTYTHFPVLMNPVSEARNMSNALKRLGFEVIQLENGTEDQILDAISDFEHKLKQRGGLALFHYGGHGVQVNGTNYIIPVDADIPDARRVKTRAVEVEEVIAALDASGSKTNIVIIDACRDNPLPGGNRSGTRGLAAIANQPSDSIIVYSADAGTVAQDGLFTPTVLKYIETPDLEFYDLLKKVRIEVRIASGGNQKTGEYNQLESDIFLAGKSTPSDKQIRLNDNYVKIESVWFNLYGPKMSDNSTEFDYTSDKNKHETWLGSFYVDPYETTFEDYDRFANAMGWTRPDDEGWGRGRRPVIHVSFMDMVAYANWKSEQSGLDPCYSKIDDIVLCDFTKNGYRLPTISEWEYIAREGGKEISNPWGDKYPYGNLPGKDPFIKEYIVEKYSEGMHPLAHQNLEYPEYIDGYSYTSEVGSFIANSLGLFDLEGNVTEQCWDYYWGNYWDDSTDPSVYFVERNPTGPSNEEISRWGEPRVRYGSSWKAIVDINKPYFGSFPGTYYTDKVLYDDVGFRLVRTTEK